MMGCFVVDLCDVKAVLGYGTEYMHLRSKQLLNYLC